MGAPLFLESCVFVLYALCNTVAQSEDRTASDVGADFVPTPSDGLQSRRPVRRERRKKTASTEADVAPAVSDPGGVMECWDEPEVPVEAATKGEDGHCVPREGAEFATTVCMNVRVRANGVYCVPSVLKRCPCLR